MATPKQLTDFLASRPVDSVSGLKDFWLFAVAERNKHPDQQCEIAQFVFSSTPKNLLQNDQLEAIHFELGALMAPGMPEPGEAVHEYDERLWQHFESLVKTIELEPFI